MIPNISKYLVCSYLLTASFVVLADESSTRNYLLPGHGNLQLSVPKSWQEEVRQPPNRLPPTIVFTPKSGSSFQILLTPMYPMRQGVAMPTPAEVQTNVTRAAENAKSQALEKNISVKELRGTSSIGYYFSATDKSPKTGEYKYMTQGMLRVGELAPTFTILTNDGAEGVVVEALAMLKNAVYVGNKAP